MLKKKKTTYLLLHLYALPKNKRLASVREALWVILTPIWDFDLGEIRRTERELKIFTQGNSELHNNIPSRFSLKIISDATIAQPLQAGEHGQTLLSLEVFQLLSPKTSEFCPLLTELEEEIIK